MKLVDWLLKEDLADPLDIDALVIAAKDGRKLGAMEGYKSDGLHIIGTCGECKYWGDRDMTWDEDARPYRICENENEDGNMGISSPMQRCSNEFLKDFGCIHFEAKGEK